jgi:phosphate-selective porin OprO/OprP
MGERVRSEAGEEPPQAQRSGLLVVWALAFALLVSPIGASGADPAATPDAAESAHAAEQEAAALEDELLEQERPERRFPPFPGALPEGWSYEWRNGSRLRRNDGRYELHFGGQVQYEVAQFRLDDGLKRTDQSGWDSDWDFRRLRAYLQGFAFDHLMFRVAYDFEDEELKDLYAGFRDLGPLGAVQVGYMKAPFSLEQAMSLQNLTFLERSLAFALVPFRNTGVLATSTHFDQRLRWAAGVYFLDESLADDDGGLEGLENDWEIAARVNWVPVSAEDGSRLVMTGVSYSHIFGDAEGLTFGSRPESRLLPALIQTPEISGLAGGDQFGVELAWLERSLSFQAEVNLASVHRDQGLPDLLFWGAYAQVSYFLTGERRVYGRAAGAFGRVIPKKPFRPSRRHWGAFQVAARASMLDLNDSDIRGGQQLNFTLGLNWYLLANLRLSANYVHGRVFGQGDVDIVQARLQVDF